jgi:hypothetical protein
MQCHITWHLNPDFAFKRQAMWHRMAPNLGGAASVGSTVVASRTAWSDVKRSVCHASGVTKARLVALAAAIAACTAVTGCSSSSHGATTGTFRVRPFDVFNDLDMTLTLRAVVPITGESLQAARYFVRQQGCTPPIGGCILWTRTLAPGQTTSVATSLASVEHLWELVILGSGTPTRCMPIAPPPANAVDPTFTVSAIKPPTDKLLGCERGITVRAHRIK